MTKLCCSCRDSCNLLTLERFRALFMYHPYWFHQLANERLIEGKQCSSLVHEHAWQSAGMAGRSDVREAIVRAEQILKSYLGYSTGVRPECEEITGLRWHDLYRPLALDCGYVQGLGKYRLDEIAADDQVAAPTVILKDDTFDSLWDTFELTMVIPPGMSDLTADEVVVYFPEAERYDSVDKDVLGCRWQVRPVSVTVDHDAGTIQVCGRSWLIVRPIYYAGFHPSYAQPGYNNPFTSNGAINPDPVENYASTLAVYRKRLDPEQQGVLRWKCADECCNEVPVTLCIDDKQMGLVSVQSIDGTALASTSPKDLVCASCQQWHRCDEFSLCLNYVAGDCIGSWDKTVAQLAAAELCACICECGNSAMTQAQHELNRTDQVGQYVLLSSEDLGNPLGMRRGQMDAWKRIRNERLIGGFCI